MLFRSADALVECLQVRIERVETLLGGGVPVVLVADDLAHLQRQPVAVVAEFGEGRHDAVLLHGGDANPRTGTRQAGCVRPFGRW